MGSPWSAGSGVGSKRSICFGIWCWATRVRSVASGCGCVDRQKPLIRRARQGSAVTVVVVMWSDILHFDLVTGCSLFGVSEAPSVARITPRMDVK